MPVCCQLDAYRRVNFTSQDTGEDRIDLIVKLQTPSILEVVFRETAAVVVFNADTVFLTESGMLAAANTNQNLPITHCL